MWGTILVALTAADGYKSSPDPRLTEPHQRKDYTVQRRRRRERGGGRNRKQNLRTASPTSAPFGAHADWK